MPLPPTVETEYEAEGTQVYDPAGYYGASREIQSILDNIMALAGLDRDRVTMVAIGAESVGLWHHSDHESEYLTRWSASGMERFELGPMDRGDV